MPDVSIFKLGDTAINVKDSTDRTNAASAQQAASAAQTTANQAKSAAQTAQEAAKAASTAAQGAASAASTAQKAAEAAQAKIEEIADLSRVEVAYAQGTETITITTTNHAAEG